MTKYLSLALLIATSSMSGMHALQRFLRLSALFNTQTPPKIVPLRHYTPGPEKKGVTNTEKIEAAIEKVQEQIEAKEDEVYELKKEEQELKDILSEAEHNGNRYLADLARYNKRYCKKSQTPIIIKKKQPSYQNETEEEPIVDYAARVRWGDEWNFKFGL